MAVAAGSREPTPLDKQGFPLQPLVRQIRNGPEKIRSKPARGIRWIFEIRIAAIDRQEASVVVATRALGPAGPVMTIHAVADRTATAVPTIDETSLQPGIERDLRTAVLFGRQVEVVGHIHQIVPPGSAERADAVLANGPSFGLSCHQNVAHTQSSISFVVTWIAARTA